MTAARTLLFLLAILGVTVFSSSTNNGPSNSKNVCLAHSTLSTSYIFVYVLWSSAPFFGQAVTLLSQRAKEITILAAPVSHNIFVPSAS